MCDPFWRNKWVHELCIAQLRIKTCNKQAVKLNSGTNGTFLHLLTHSFVSKTSMTATTLLYRDMQLVFLLFARQPLQIYYPSHVSICFQVQDFMFIRQVVVTRRSLGRECDSFINDQIPSASSLFHIFYFTQRYGQNGACSMVETAQGKEREGHDQWTDQHLDWKDTETTEDKEDDWGEETWYHRKCHIRVSVLRKKSCTPAVLLLLLIITMKKIKKITY